MYILAVMPPTKLRSLRVPPEVWDAAAARAASEGTNLSALIVGWLRDYGTVGQPGKNEGDGAGLAGRRSRMSPSSPSSQCPPHPGGRVHRGLCGACGRNVTGEPVT